MPGVVLVRRLTGLAASWRTDANWGPPSWGKRGHCEARLLFDLLTPLPRARARLTDERG